MNIFARGLILARHKKSLLTVVTRQGICFVNTGMDGCGDGDCQTKRIAPFCGIAEAIGSRALFLLVGKEQKSLEKLRA